MSSGLTICLEPDVDRRIELDSRGLQLLQQLAAGLNHHQHRRSRPEDRSANYRFLNLPLPFLGGLSMPQTAGIGPVVGRDELPIGARLSGRPGLGQSLKAIEALELFASSLEERVDLATNESDGTHGAD